MNPGLHLLKRSLNRQLFNPTTVKHHDLDCHIATAKQCGTHWIKYMLSLVLCDKYGLPPPEHIRDDAVVGHTKNRPVHGHIPQIAVTHSHPHYLLRSKAVHHLLHLPSFIILVRDPRDILVSSYEKTRGEYLNKKMKTDQDVTFSQYLRGDVTGKTRILDIWDIILFFNAWGAVFNAHPGRVFMLKYEQMKNDPVGALRSLCRYIGIEGVTDEQLADIVERSSRERMREKLDTDEAQFEKSVNVDTGKRNFKDWYDEEDRAFADHVFKDYLIHDFGYDLTDWT